MKFQLLEGGNSLGVNVEIYDFLKRKGFKVCKYQLNLDKIPCIIIEDLIDTEQ